jgi:AFG3 family protein
MEAMDRLIESEQKKQKAKKSSSSSSSSSAGDEDDDNDGKWYNKYNPLKGAHPLVQALVFGAFGLFAYGTIDAYSYGTTEIDWPTFNGRLLESGEIDRIVVIDENIVQVFMKESVDGSYFGASSGGDSNGRYGLANVFPSRKADYWLTIGSAASFEKKLRAAEDELERDAKSRLPVAHTMSSGKAMARSFATGLMMVALLVAMVMQVTRVGGGAGGAGSIFQIGKSTAKRTMGKNVKERFADVAGQEEAKVEVMEFVEFLRNPAKFERLGARIPKGALLVGPPGCGKTMLAKATAGEAGVPFFAISGSDFIEMFVGVGPARVRDLFKQARAAAPSIIFIDEIDAVGRSRASNGFGGNDERENTLNQLLVEMDGFADREGVVVLAGTNRADVLDNALKRPGRFDRQIAIGLADIKGRKDIFMVHLKPLKLADASEGALLRTAQKLATLTPGMSGADIANICNEAALIAARYQKSAIELVDFEAAIERVIGGIEKKTKRLSAKEKRIVAYHEAGHAIVGWYLEHADPLLKVSIVPRGSAALGYAQLQVKDQYLLTAEQLRDRICMALGGRVAEQLVFDEITTGAADDLDKVTKWAYGQITRYGMNEAVGNLSFPDPDEQEIQRPYSQKTARLIDLQVRQLVTDLYQRTTDLIAERRDQLELVAQRLLEREVLQRDDMEEMLGKRIWSQKTSYEELTDTN